ncbi:MAG TPA: cupin domain-containing protein [Pseudomonadota bacterium]|nr:cupin domain-containing protein [Pseudomonadota bacterium]
MPKIDITAVPAERIGSYPKKFATVIAGREKQKLGDAAGLTQFGVNITRIKPGSGSALRHCHEHEDEFIYMIEGELVLQENDGETVLSPGDAAGFKAGSGIGHCLINRGTADAIYLEVGTRAASKREHYSDVDLVMERDGSGRRYLNRSGVIVWPI